MQIELVTRQDLENFKRDLVRELAEFMSQHTGEKEKEWLRSKEVRQLLGGISANTLQNLRIKGLLHPTRVEGVYYYKLSEIKDLLNANRGQ